MAYDFAGKQVLITGAASGIGRATALRLASEGAVLFLTDINAEALGYTVADARALGAEVRGHRVLDVADHDAVAAFSADVHSRHAAMDVVMNIAGISAWGTVDHLTHRHWRSMIDVNLMGPINVIEAFVPPMVAAARAGRSGGGRYRGRLVNVASAAGLVAFPWHAAYSASKFGLRGMSEVLRFDLAGYRIGVSVVVPGAVNTPLVKTVEIAGVDRDNPRVQWWVKRFSGHAVSAERAAEKILAGVAKNRYLIYTSPDIRALYAFKRFAWLPYSAVMSGLNIGFSRVLRPRGVEPVRVREEPQV